MNEAGGDESAPRDVLQTTQGVGIRSCDMLVYAKLDNRQIADAPCTVFDMVDPFNTRTLPETDADAVSTPQTPSTSCTHGQSYRMIPRTCNTWLFSIPLK
jgi:hypothetical protein